MPKKSTEIKNIYMTFVGRPSEEAIENFVKQARRIRKIISETEDGVEIRKVVK